jgi:hypothetical protein
VFFPLCLAGLSHAAPAWSSPAQTRQPIVATDPANARTVRALARMVEALG